MMVRMVGWGLVITVVVRVSILVLKTNCGGARRCGNNSSSSGSSYSCSSRTVVVIEVTVIVLKVIINNGALVCTLPFKVRFLLTLSRLFVVC